MVAIYWGRKAEGDVAIDSLFWWLIELRADVLFPQVWNALILSRKHHPLTVYAITRQSARRIIRECVLEIKFGRCFLLGKLNYPLCLGPQQRYKRGHKTAYSPCTTVCLRSLFALLNGLCVCVCVHTREIERAASERSFDPGTSVPAGRPSYATGASGLRRRLHTSAFGARSDNLHIDFLLWAFILILQNMCLLITCHFDLNCLKLSRFYTSRSRCRISFRIEIFSLLISKTHWPCKGFF